MSSALQAIATDYGLKVLSSKLKNTVTTYKLIGALEHDSNNTYEFYSAQIETSYFDKYGVVTFVLEMPTSTHFDEYLHQIQVLDANGKVVISCNTPKVALASGIGGMVTLKAAVKGKAGEVIFKASDYVTNAELNDFWINQLAAMAESIILLQREQFKQRTEINALQNGDTL